MRGLLPGLVNPHPMTVALPGLYQDDDFAQQFVSAFDDALAPVLCALDNLEAYLDPWLAPADFVEWLAGWVGLALDETWPLERQRALVATAAQLFRWRGTARGVAGEVALYTGSEPEVVESGGANWSPTPGGPMPGSAERRLRVRVRVPDPAAVDRTRLDRIVAAAKPADVAHEVEVVAG